MTITNTLLESPGTILAVGRPIDASLKSINSTVAILANQSPLVTNVIQTISAIRDLERENELLRQFERVDKQDHEHSFQPLIARREHLRQELRAVQERRKYYVPPLDKTWEELDEARSAYNTTHHIDSNLSITPGGAVLLRYTLRIVAAQMDTLSHQLAAGGNMVELRSQLDGLTQDNLVLRERTTEWVYEHVHEVMMAEHELQEAKVALEELQQAQEARLSELQAVRVRPPYDAQRKDRYRRTVRTSRGFLSKLAGNACGRSEEEERIVPQIHAHDHELDDVGDLPLWLGAFSPASPVRTAAGDPTGCAASYQDCSVKALRGGVMPHLLCDEFVRAVCLAAMEYRLEWVAGRGGGEGCLSKRKGRAMNPTGRIFRRIRLIIYMIMIVNIEDVWPIWRVGWVPRTVYTVKAVSIRTAVTPEVRDVRGRVPRGSLTGPLRTMQPTAAALPSSSTMAIGIMRAFWTAHEPRFLGWFEFVQWHCGRGHLLCRTMKAMGHSCPSAGPRISRSFPRRDAGCGRRAVIDNADDRRRRRRLVGGRRLRLFGLAGCARPLPGSMCMITIMIVLVVLVRTG
ncbi:hypothetical protein CALCODRAFT_506496 [Calocera cornea HHB12733]|uniref:Uncharacterized protein n=1 Tax=Calocera cornea HHB12733 TaxID=1353952 RepID=A0A165IX31_9BASI|nr:hypothetical protein CALCODRAFT_506496 [Calocera cornea HHB12733]